MINKTNSEHYKWGENCESWNFVDKESLSVKLEIMPAKTREKLHFHQSAQQFFFILKGKAVFYLTEKKETINEREGIMIEPSMHHFIANETEHELEFLMVSQPTTTNDRINIQE